MAATHGVRTSGSGGQALVQTQHTVRGGWRRRCTAAATQRCGQGLGAAGVALPNPLVGFAKSDVCFTKSDVCFTKSDVCFTKSGDLFLLALINKASVRPLMWWVGQGESNATLFEAKAVQAAHP